jgi:hypothetical protein
MPFAIFCSRLRKIKNEAGGDEPEIGECTAEMLR